MRNQKDVGRGMANGRLSWPITIGSAKKDYKTNCPAKCPVVLETMHMSETAYWRHRMGGRERAHDYTPVGSDPDTQSSCATCMDLHIHSNLWEGIFGVEQSTWYSTTNSEKRYLVVIGAQGSELRQQGRTKEVGESCTCTRASRYDEINSLLNLMDIIIGSPRD